MTRYSHGFIQKPSAGDPSITFIWAPIDDEVLPVGASLSRASVAQQYDGTDFSEVSSGTIREDSVAVVGGPKGFLIEPGATNQMIQSSDLTDAAWSQTGGGSIVDNGTGSLGLDQQTIDNGAATNLHRVLDGAQSSSAGSAYFICKQGPTTPGRFMTIRRGSDQATYYACYDLQDGLVTEEGSNSDAAIVTDYGDGWYKCHEDSSQVNGNCVWSSTPDGTPGNGTPTFAGGDLEYLVCHAQYEDTAFSTTPVIRAGTSIPRVAEVLDMGVVISTAFSVVLDLTLPDRIGTGNTITLLGPDTTAEDILRVDEDFDLIMDDGGTPVTIGTSSAGARIKVAYGRDATGRSASLDGAPIDTGGAPGAGHEGENFELGSRAGINQSRCIHHATTLYNERKSNGELVTLAASIVAVFLLAGQSNTLNGLTRAAADSVKTSGIEQWGRIGGDDGLIVPAFEPLQNAAFASNPEKIGFAYEFAKIYKLSNPNEKVLLVPVGRGSTGFITNDWNQGDPDYDDAVDRTNAALAAREGHVLKGVLWHQGETEAIASTAEATYANLLDTMIADMRADITGATDIPFVVGELAQDFIDVLPAGRQPTQDAITDTPNRVSDTAVVLNTSLTTYDNTHYDAASQRTLGQRYYDAFIAI